MRDIENEKMIELQREIERNMKTLKEVMDSTSKQKNELGKDSIEMKMKKKGYLNH